MTQSLKGNFMLQILELPWREASLQHSLDLVGAVDTSVNSAPCEGECTSERLWAGSGSVVQMCGRRHGGSWGPELTPMSLPRDRTLGSNWEQRLKEETFTAAQCSSQKRQLQQWVGWEPVKGIYSQLVLLNQPSSTALLAPCMVLTPGSRSRSISSWCFIQH